MIWTDEDLEAAREMQRKKAAYAKDLEQQIELRRATQRREQQELEEFERKFQPDEHSPAKWLVDGGYSSNYRSPFRFPPQPSPSAHEQQQQRDHFQSFPQQQHRMDDHSANDAPMDSFYRPQTATLSPSASRTPLPLAGQATGAPTSVERRDSRSSNPQHPRFRITSADELTDRNRERAQQLEWRRVLDDQVRENARLKQPEEDAQRRTDAGDAREEMMVLRDLQLRAQRRMGLPEVASEPSPTIPKQQHDAFDPHYISAFHHQQLHEHELHHHHQLPPPAPAPLQPSPVRPPPSPSPYERLPLSARTYGDVQPSPHRYHPPHYDTAAAMHMPPPAPLYPQSTAYARPNETLDDSRTNSVLSEYRALLTEIRQEREALRNERDDVRREKDVLQLERARLALESERLARLLDTQQQQQQQQQPYLYQRKQQTMRNSPDRSEYTPLRSVERPSQRAAFDLSQQLRERERSFVRPPPARAAAAVPNRRVVEPPLSPSPLQQQHSNNGAAAHRRPSAMSMADFAIPQNRLSPNVVDSPRFKRLAKFQLRSPPRSDNDDCSDRSDNDNAFNTSRMDESLAGESVFVALRPEELANGHSPSPSTAAAAAATSRGPPRITETLSPARRSSEPPRARRDDDALRNSRVIQSRGFYNIDSDAAAFGSLSTTTTTAARQQPTRRASARTAPRNATKPDAEAAVTMSQSVGMPHRERRRSSTSHSSRQQQQQHNRRHEADERQQEEAKVEHEEDGDDERELSQSMFQVKVLV